MQRVAFVQWVRAGCQEKYIEAHANVWPELARTTLDAGASNYTGFIGGPDRRLVVGYFETDDVDAMMRRLAASEVNSRWAAQISPLMDSGGDLSNGSMEFLTPIWRIS